MKKLARDQPAGHWLDLWHVDPSVNREYDFIDGLRGLAILMVLVGHSGYGREHQNGVVQCLQHFFDTFGHGVFLFFTLSGFLISWPFWKRKANHAAVLTPPGYGWRRFWKIYPPLALSVILLLPVYILWFGNARVFLHAAFQWLTGLAFLLPVTGSFNPVMWSLVVEIHFYLVLPLLFLLTKPLSPGTCSWAIPLFLFVIPVSIQTLTGLTPTFSPEINDPFCTGLSCFCLGVAVAGIDTLKIWNQNWARLGDAGWFMMLFALGGLAWLDLPATAHGVILPQVFHEIFLLGTACLLCYATASQNARARWLAAPWLRWCGIISYEWYLVHQPFIYWCRALLGPANGNLFRQCLMVGLPTILSLTLAALIYLKFSLPILKYGRSKKLAAKAKPGTIQV